MPTLLTVTGRDVLFAHWPLDADRIAAAVPDAFAVETFDGTGWVSALALENASVTPGSMRLPEGVGRAFPQLNLRTYVALDGDPGVYFLSLDAGRTLPATVGRRAFGLPFRRARMRLSRHGDRITFRSYRTGDDGPPAVFQARYGPAGDPSTADPGSLAEFCIEHDRYYLPAPEDRRAGPLRSLDVDRGTTFDADRGGGPDADRGRGTGTGGDGRSDTHDDGSHAGDREGRSDTDGSHTGDRDGRSGADRRAIYVGRIERDPWLVAPATARVRRNTLFEAAGLPTPGPDPAVHYSPGFEMGVEPLEVRRPDGPSTPTGIGHR